MPTARFGDRTGGSPVMDYAGTQDCDIVSSYSDYNSGVAQYFTVGDYYYAPAEAFRALIAFDLKSFYDDHPDATITAARIVVYCAQRTTT